MKKKNKTPQEAAAEFRRKMQKIADEGGVTISISTGNQEPIVIAKPQEKK